MSRLAVLLLVALAACPRPTLVGRPCAIDGDCVDADLACVASKCAQRVEAADAGEVGVTDAGTPDAGFADAGFTDAGTVVVHDPPQTCADVKALNPDAGSGSYALDFDHNGVLDDDRNHDGVVDAADDIFCNLTIDGGGWINLAFLNETTIGQEGCPPGWTLVDHSQDAVPFIGCDRDASTGGAASAFVQPFYEFREVMGVVTAVDFGSNDAFFDLPNFADSSIDTPYVDGVSVTTGADVRIHLFTFAAGSPGDVGAGACPCAGGPAPQAFVGDHYVCDAPSLAAETDAGPAFDPSTPLWGSATNTCAPATGFFAPFFVADSGASRLDPIEVRLMSDEPNSDEDIAVTRLELYAR